MSVILMFIVILLIVVAAALATPPGRLPLAVRGIARTLGKDVSAGLFGREGVVSVRRKALAFLLVVLAAIIAISL